MEFKGKVEEEEEVTVYFNMTNIEESPPIITKVENWTRCKGGVQFLYCTSYYLF